MNSQQSAVLSVVPVTLPVCIDSLIRVNMIPTRSAAAVLLLWCIMIISAVHVQMSKLKTLLNLLRVYINLYIIFFSLRFFANRPGRMQQTVDDRLMEFAGFFALFLPSNSHTKQSV